MRYLVLFLIVLAIVYVLGTLRSRRSAPSATTSTVRVADAPRVLQQLQASGSDGSFAVFMFNAPNGAGADHVVNLQFSIEGGRPGLDWVLMAPQNIRDQDRFVRLAEDLGYTAEAREMNDVRYLRVEHGDLARLSMAVMQDLYGFQPTDEVELLVEGFDWQPTA